MCVVSRGHVRVSCMYAVRVCSLLRLCVTRRRRRTGRRMPQRRVHRSAALHRERRRRRKRGSTEGGSKAAREAHTQKGGGQACGQRFAGRAHRHAPLLPSSALAHHRSLATPASSATAAASAAVHGRMKGASSSASAVDTAAPAAAAVPMAFHSRPQPQKAKLVAGDKIVAQQYPMMKRPAAAPTVSAGLGGGGGKHRRKRRRKRAAQTRTAAATVRVAVTAAAAPRPRPPRPIPTQMQTHLPPRRLVRSVAGRQVPRAERLLMRPLVRPLRQSLQRPLQLHLLVRQRMALDGLPHVASNSWVLAASCRWSATITSCWRLRRLLGGGEERGGR
jgi:hypothetical protein